MSSKQTRRVVSKKEPQKSTQKPLETTCKTTKWIIVSRIANAKLRQELEFGDFWEHNMDYEDEIQALDDFTYLTRYRGVREYMLARMKVIDPLNDPIPL